MKLTVNISKEHKDFLETIKFEDAAKNNSEAVAWCIDSCIKIEERYQVDACYVAYNDIVLDVLLRPNADDLSIYNVKFYDDKNILQVHATNFTTAGIQAMAYKIIKDRVGFGIEWLESDETHNRVPFEL